MKFKIAIAAEGLLLCYLVLTSISSLFGTLANFRATKAAALGLDLVQLDKPESARLQFEDAVAARSDFQGGYQALLHLYLSTDSPDEEAAQKTADKLLALTGKKGRSAAAAYMALGVIKVREAMATDDQSQKVELLKAADLEFRRASERADPESAESFVNRGIVNFMIYKELKQQPYLTRSALLLDTAKRKRAISVHALYPLTFVRGNVLFEQGRRQSSLAEMARCQELDPAQGRGLTNLAVAHAHTLMSPVLSAEQKRALLQQVEKLVDESNPAYYLLRCAIGATYFEVGRYDDAVSLFRSLSTKYKDKGSALANLGAVLYAHFKRSVNQNKPARPISDAVDALYAAEAKDDLGPRERAKCWNILALCKREGYPFPKETKEPKQLYSAEYCLRKAIQLDKTYWAAPRNLGILHQLKKEWKDALRYYRLSLDANKAQVDLDRAVRQFESPPQIMNPREYTSAMSVIPGSRGITQKRFAAMLLAVRPSYPGKIDKDSTKLTIDGKPQAYWEFISDNDILLVVRDPLADGVHKLVALFEDAGGNRKDLTWEFVVDLNNPIIKSRKPAGEEPATTASTFEVVLWDSSGINLKSIGVTVSRPTSGSTRPLTVIRSGEYQYDMLPLKQFRGDRVKSERIQFTLPKGFIAGDSVIAIQFSDQSRRSYVGEPWKIKIVEEEE